MLLFDLHIEVIWSGLMAKERSSRAREGVLRSIASHANGRVRLRPCADAILTQAPLRDFLDVGRKMSVPKAHQTVPKSK